MHKEKAEGSKLFFFAKATLAAHISISNNIFSFDVVRQSEKERKKTSFRKKGSLILPLAFNVLQVWIWREKRVEEKSEIIKKEKIRGGKIEEIRELFGALMDLTDD